MRNRFAAWLFVAAANLPAGFERAHAETAAAQHEPEACPVTRSEDRIASVTDDGEIRLASGRIAKLAGIRLPDEPGVAARASAFLREHAGSSVEVAALASEPDRWGRVAAMVTVGGDAGPLDLNRALVAGGFAVVDAGERNALCQPGLLATEARARGFGLGLWRLERYKPAPAAALERLQALTGKFALVEGRIRSVGERKRRTYLNFGADWNTDFTITIPQRTWKTMRERGLTASTLRGRQVRARGLIEDWNGPAITIMAPEMLEILDEGGPRRRS